jgi:hypothetical protein
MAPVISRIGIIGVGVGNAASGDAAGSPPASDISSGGAEIQAAKARQMARASERMPNDTPISDY